MPSPANNGQCGFLPGSHQLGSGGPATLVAEENWEGDLGLSPSRSGEGLGHLSECGIWVQ